MGTRRPLLMMLDCTLRRQLRQTALWLFGGLYLLLVLAVVFPLCIFGGSQTGFQSLQLLNVLMALFVPAYGGSQIVDDVASGTLMLMKVTGMSSGTWVMFRLLSIAAAYVTIWMVRLPVYSMLLHSGTAFADILWSEALTWCLMIGCAQLSLFISRYSDPQKAAIGASIGFLFVLNAFFFLPSVLTYFVRFGGVFSIPDWTEAFATFSRDLSILRYVFSGPASPEDWVAAAIALAIPLAFGGVATFWLRRLLFIQVEPGAPQAAALLAKEELPQTRPSRRVWDDAFAWQAAEFYHSPGRRRWTILWLAATCSLVLGFQHWTGTDISVSIGIWMVFSFASPGLVPVTCVTQEFQQNTLSSLGMLPVGGTAIYRGWLRGGRRRRSGAWMGAAIAMTLLLWSAPARAPIWAAAALTAAYVLPPIGFVETLASHEVNWRRAVRVVLVVVPFQLSAFLGMAKTTAFVLIGALIYRPRAVQLIETRFESASAR